MRVAFLDLARRIEARRSDLNRALAAVLDESRFVLGSESERFEAEWAEYCGARHALGVANGTDAIGLALEALGVQPGDEVVVPANTCVPTIAGIEAARGVPVLADVDPVSRTLDPAALEAALSERTRAVVLVHLYGQCGSMDDVCAIARGHGLKVLEDAAQAHGAEYGGRRAGTLADAAAFSFYPTKNLGALGDAGAVVTDDPDVAERVARARCYGERTRNESVTKGRNSRLDTLQAAALRVFLPHLDAGNARRRELAAFYGTALEDLDLELPAEMEGRRHVYHLYVVRTKARELLRARLAERGIETLVHYPRPVHAHPAYTQLAQPRLEESESLAREVLSLPLYPELRDDEAQAVAFQVREALSEMRVPTR